MWVESIRSYNAPRCLSPRVILNEKRLLVLCSHYPIFIPPFRSRKARFSQLEPRPNPLHLSKVGGPRRLTGCLLIPMHNQPSAPQSRTQSVNSRLAALAPVEWSKPIALQGYQCYWLGNGVPWTQLQRSCTQPRKSGLWKRHLMTFGWRSISSSSSNDRSVLCQQSAIARTDTAPVSSYEAMRLLPASLTFYRVRGSPRSLELTPPSFLGNSRGYCSL